jgi:alkanesulfonate monooxygenase SsuD/methylene tetrahydromethanopterin reductase-like flavin-dependent oxidoreductase (luciferase family)
MRCGFILPTSEPQPCADLAALAEQSGWDGVFIPDCIAIETRTIPPLPAYDPWVTLAAMALNTRRVRLGTMLTALPRRRPWKLAREVMTLDHLSHGRAILAVGVGAAQDDAGFYKVGEPMDLKTRAELLDEGLAVLDGLWRGQPFTFHGRHYHVDAMTLLPRPVQQPRVPLWVVGVWPRARSLDRALRYDGLVPQKKFGPGQAPGPIPPDDLRAIRAYIAEHRPRAAPFDLIAEGETPAGNPRQAAEQVRPLAEAGATWWLESRWSAGDDWESAVRERIRQGPPLSVGAFK